MLIEDIWALPADIEIHSATLIITQEDGRTAYANGIGSRLFAATPALSLTFLAMFSDRINPQAPSAPVNTPAFGQGYLQNQPMSNRDIDPMSLSIARLGVQGNYATNVQLLRWGASFNLQLRLSPQTRTYQAIGPTIGNAPGSALYIVSFQG